MDTINIQFIKERYFSKEEWQISLKKGEFLLEPGQINERLFLILKGELKGYIANNGEQFEIFRSGPNKLVGTFSFFDPSHKSYASVIAEEDTHLAYIDQTKIDTQGETYRHFATHMLPMVVREIYARQLLAHKASIERNHAIKRLMKAEKMATLGQMAAGLAHELNNAVGVIQQKTDWLSAQITDYIRSRGEEDLFPFYEKGLNEGQALSTLEIRNRKKLIQEELKIPPKLAKRLARCGLNLEEIKSFGAELEENINFIQTYYDMGLALHDMLLAAKHATRVVQSVKEMGAANRQQLVETNLNKTIQEAITLIKNLTKKVNIHLKLSELPTITVNPGDFVQIWINLIKNSVEALLGAHTKGPKITIQSKVVNEYIVIDIIDNGPGIPDHLKEKIFRPNFTTKIDGLSFGLGLGLPKVQKLVESYNGSIKLDSKVGRTKFSIHIPLN